MSEIYKVKIPILLTTICGLIMIWEFYFSTPEPIIQTNIILRSFVTIVASGGLILGNCLLFIGHVKTVTVKKKEWYFSILFLGSFIVTTLLGLISVRNTYFLWLYNNMTAPIGAALYALTGFYITSASYRVFRAKNLHALILLGVAFIMILAYIPIGTVYFPAASTISDWLFNYPSTSAQRGVTIGLALGTISLAIRIFMGKQKEHLGIMD